MPSIYQHFFLMYAEPTVYDSLYHNAVENMLGVESSLPWVVYCCCVLHTAPPAKECVVVWDLISYTTLGGMSQGCDILGGEYSGLIYSRQTGVGNSGCESIGCEQRLQVFAVTCLAGGEECNSIGCNGTSCTEGLLPHSRQVRCHVGHR